MPLVIGAILVTTGEISLGQLSAAMIYLTQCVAAQSQIIEWVPALTEKSMTVSILSDFLTKKPSVAESASARHVDFAGADILIENLSFSYL